MNREQKRSLIIVFSLCFMLIPVSITFSSESSPMEDLHKPIGEIIRIIENRDCASNAAGCEELRRIFHRLFDFREISKRSLGTCWKDFTFEQRETFTRIFSQFLAAIFLSRMQSEYRYSTSDYLSQTMIGTSKAMVRTKVVRGSGTEVSIIYSMRKYRLGWRVYDINIEGISLIHNYRSQFKGILMTKNPAHLITLLKEKRQQQIDAYASHSRLIADRRLTKAQAEWHQFAQQCLLTIWLEAGDLKR